MGLESDGGSSRGGGRVRSTSREAGSKRGEEAILPRLGHAYSGGSEPPARRSDSLGLPRDAQGGESESDDPIRPIDARAIGLRIGSRAITEGRLVIFYHFTSTVHWERILSQGIIKPTDPHLNENPVAVPLTSLDDEGRPIFLVDELERGEGRDLGPLVVWLTSDPRRSS